MLSLKQSRTKIYLIIISNKLLQTQITAKLQSKVNFKSPYLEEQHFTGNKKLDIYGNSMLIKIIYLTNMHIKTNDEP